MFLSVRSLFCRCKHKFVKRCACTEDKNTGDSSLFNVNSLHSHVRKVSIIWAKQCMKAYNIFLLWLRIKLLVFIAFKFIFIYILKVHWFMKLSRRKNNPSSSKISKSIESIVIFKQPKELICFDIKKYKYN